MPFVGKLDGQLVSTDGKPVRDRLLKRDYPTTQIPIETPGVRCVSCDAVMPFLVLGRWWRHRPGEGDHKCDRRFTEISNEGPWHRETRELYTTTRRKSGLWNVRNEAWTDGLERRADLLSKPSRKRPAGLLPFVEYGPVADEFQDQDSITSDTITGRITHFRDSFGASTFWHLSHDIWRITKRTMAVPHVAETPDRRVTICTRIDAEPEDREYAELDVDRFVHDRAHLGIVWHPDYALLATSQAMAEYTDGGNRRVAIPRRQPPPTKGWHSITPCERDPEPPVLFPDATTPRRPMLVPALEACPPHHPVAPIPESPRTECRWCGESLPSYTFDVHEALRHPEHRTTRYQETA